MTSLDETKPGSAVAATLHPDKPVARWQKGRSQMTCTAITQETADVKSFRLEQDEGTLFLFKPGDSIVLEFTARGKRVFRNYTIASSPSRPHAIELTIKRDPKGLVSRWMHDNLRVGDQLSVTGPVGVFNCIDIPAEKMLMLSGGSGITPVMSMSRWLCDTTRGAHDIRFLHSARTPGDIIYRDELAYLHQTHPGFSFDAICENAEAHPDWGGPTGYLTAGLLQDLARDFHDRTIYCCGPAPYMEAVKTILRDAGYDMARYHEESFTEGRGAVDRDTPSQPEDLTVALPGEAPALAVAPQTGSGESAHVTFARSGVGGHAQPGQTILELAHSLGIAVPTSCCMGLCGTCKSKVLEGQVDLPEREGLTDAELAEGYTLVCVGQPQGAVVLEL